MSTADPGVDGMPVDLLRAVRAAGLRVDEAPLKVDTRDLEAEVRAAREGAVLCWSHDRAPFVVSGADRVPFLHRMLTQELQEAAPGDHRRALLLDQKGRIVADLDLGFEADRILGVTAAAVLERTFEGLQRFVLRDDIRFESIRSDHAVLWLGGPAAAEVLGSAGLQSVPDGGLSTVRLGEIEARLLRAPTVPSGVEIVVPAATAAATWDLLLEAGADHDILPLGAAAAEVLRIEAGIPAHGAELTASEFPQEARLDDAVDFDKGCYLGQETVARIHYRGKVNRLLSGLGAEARLEAGCGLLVGDREVGVITSAARRPTGDWVALGYVRTEHADPGTVLRLAGSAGSAGGATTAEVRDVDWWSRSGDATASGSADR